MRGGGQHGTWEPSVGCGQEAGPEPGSDRAAKPLSPSFRFPEALLSLWIFYCPSTAPSDFAPQALQGARATFLSLWPQLPEANPVSGQDQGWVNPSSEQGLPQPIPKRQRGQGKAAGTPHLLKPPPGPGHLNLCSGWSLPAGGGVARSREETEGSGRIQAQGGVGGPYLGGQVFHQGHHGVLEECAGCQGALGHLCDVLLPIWPHGPQGGVRAVDTGCMASRPPGQPAPQPGHL